jgi:N-acetylglucosaminyldiphosphoundecaprenol N-acetyl-beta-D-mannosaminyltransferase
MALSSAVRRIPSVDLMGLRVHNLDHREAVQYVVEALRDRRGGWIATPNVDILRQLRRSAALTRMVNGADLVIPDGMPLVWASRLKGTPLKARVAGSELVLPLAEAAAANGLGVFLLGGAPGVAERAALEIMARVRGMTPVAWFSPPFGFESDERETGRILEQIRQADPDIVVCAFGFPKQEKLVEILCREFPSKWFVCAGGTLSMIAGETLPAPRWMRRAGLEWCHRLRLEPRRLFRRYVVHDVPFATRLLLWGLLRHPRRFPAGQIASAPQHADEVEPGVSRVA